MFEHGKFYTFQLKGNTDLFGEVLELSEDWIVVKAVDDSEHILNKWQLVRAIRK